MMPPAPGRGVSPLLPLSYLVTATGAFVLAALAVPWLSAELAGHYYQPRVLALTHTVTLGWITLTIMGASVRRSHRRGAVNERVIRRGLSEPRRPRVMRRRP